MLAGPGKSQDVSDEASALSQRVPGRNCTRDLCEAIPGYRTKSLCHAGVEESVWAWQKLPELGGKVMGREQDQHSLKYQHSLECPSPGKEACPSEEGRAAG